MTRSYSHGADPKEDAPRTLLVVDDDPEIVKQIEWALSGEYRILGSSDRSGALGIFRRERPWVVLLDLGLPPKPREATEGLAALEDLLSEDALVKVIIVSGNSERANALLAVRKGAHDIFPKPVDIDELRVVLRRVFRRAELEREGIQAEERAAKVSFEEIVGNSPRMQQVFLAAKRVAATDVPILITGESGTGKEVLGRAIHSLSPRSAGPFTAINCAAIPENLLESELFGHEKGAFTGATQQRKGRLEYGSGGTLFLDEVGELRPSLQVKMLRFLQYKVIERVGGRTPIPVDARVIAATNQDLEKAVQSGVFREDLYFRLAVVKLALPPLRERGEDVIVLAEHFIDQACRELARPIKRLSRAACEALLAYAWPGNVRELENRVMRAVLMSDGEQIGPEELDLRQAKEENGGTISGLREARERLERELVEKALAAAGGNVSKAARVLGISRPTLYDLMGKYGFKE